MKQKEKEIINSDIRELRCIKKHKKCPRTSFECKIMPADKTVVRILNLFMRVSCSPGKVFPTLLSYCARSTVHAVQNEFGHDGLIYTRLRSVTFHKRSRLVTKMQGKVVICKLLLNPHKNVARFNNHK